MADAVRAAAARGDRAGRQLTIEYVLRLESSPPAGSITGTSPIWPAGGRRRSHRPDHIRPIIAPLPEAVDEGVVKHLEQLKNHSQCISRSRFDSSNVRQC